jgi:hypothetical protein
MFRIVVVVVLWIIVDGHPVVEGGVARVVFIVGVGRDRRGAMLGLVRGRGRRKLDGGFSVKSGRGLCTGGGSGLPFGYRLPIFLFFLVKYFFPFFLRLFAVSANVAALVAARALPAFDIVVQLTLCLRGNLLAFHNCVEVGPFQTGRELVGLFVGWAAGEMGFGRVFNLVWFLPVLLRSGFMAGVFGLIPFFFGYLGFGRIHNIGD